MKQNLIRDYLKKVDKATLQEILDAMPFEYHHNSSKHLGSILNNMVSKRIIVRIKKGVYRLPNKSDYKPEGNTLF